MSQNNLFDKTTSINFYEDRYTQGYMDEWPQDKKQRVYDIIREFNLPEAGEAIDFGCGNGVFTEVIRQALPGWKIFGTDISSVAIQNAKQRYPGCMFFVAGEETFKEKKFDLLFSHHVLEHVYDIYQIAGEMADLIKEQGYMFHILPCGNAGSFEYNLCRMRTDGINPQVNNRFFFEDEGHVRRLTSDQLSAIVAAHGFKLKQAYYSNQYYGALKWITEYDERFIIHLTDSGKANTLSNAVKLILLRRKLLLIKKSRLIADNKLAYHKYFTAVNNKLQNLPVRLLRRYAKRIKRYYLLRAEEEWNTQQQKSAGSAMYMFFERL